MVTCLDFSKSRAQFESLASQGVGFDVGFEDSELMVAHNGVAPSEKRVLRVAKFFGPRLMVSPRGSSGVGRD